MSRSIPNFSPDSLSVRTVGDVGDNTCCSSSSCGKSASLDSDVFDVVVVSEEENLPIDEKDGDEVMRKDFDRTPFPRKE